MTCVDTRDLLILNELDQQAQASCPGPGDIEDPRIANFLRENNDAWAESLTDISDSWDQEEDFEGLHHCTICHKQYFAAYLGSKPKCPSCRIGYQHWAYQ